MAQTADALSARNAQIEVSADNVTWVDISGSASAVTPSDQTRQSGVAYTFDGDTGILTGGKREPLEIQVRIVYTGTASEAFATVRAIHEDDGEIYLRWSPQGGAPGDKLYTTAKGVLTAFIYPPVDTEEAGPIMAGFTVTTPSVTESTISP